MKVLAGIDPGLSGALCRYVISHAASAGFVTDVADIPLEPWGEKKQHVDIKQLMRVVHSWGVDTAALERVNAMPSIGERRSMGAASAFRFGMCYGEVRGALIATGIKVIDVPPAQWKDLFELRGREKDDARPLAAHLFPNMADELKRKKDIGRAECMLIARWAVQNRFEFA